ncbi:MAG: hypothetical protein RIS35_722 [Pseudomonadota bacterium]
MNRTRFASFPLLLALLFVLVLGVAIGEWVRYRSIPIEQPPGPVRFRVERGMSAPSIAEAMNAAGIRVSPWRMQVAARLRGDSRSIRQGVYEFAAPVTLEQVLDKLVRGDVVLAQLTVIEGWSFRQMREGIARHPELAHDSAGATEAEILRRIDARESAAEGLFFPSTYRFSPGASDYEVYRAAYRLMRRTLEEVWPARASGLPLDSPYAALVLASIVEKETGRPEDRRKVAAVFVNRLRKGMPLQSDPTTIYGLGDRFDGNLRREHLRADTPHNTYTRNGLPPTPIALPGRAALEAVLNPETSTALYFVARGDGSSEFSDDLAAHNRAVARYQLKRP